MQKKVLFYLFMLLSVVQTKAQLFPLNIDSKVSNAQLITEGRVIDQKSFWNDKHTMIYTSNTIEMYKIFKGQVSSSTIEVLTQGGVVDDYAIIASDLLQLNKNQVGIFFLQPNEMRIKSPFTNKELMDVYGSDQGFLRYNLNAGKAYAPFAVYKNIEATLYKTLQQKTGATMRVVDNSFQIKTAQPSSSVMRGGSVASISAFSPATVYAGALNDELNNILTITGSGFGTASSGKAILFKSADDDNEDPTYQIDYNSPYIISWTDNEIKVRVPSKAATGIFAIKISDTDTTFSTTPLKVFTAILNAEFTINGKKVVKEPRLMNTNTQGGYTILYSTSTAGKGKNINTSPEKATFQRALNTWKEQVGANILEGGTTTMQTVDPGDGNNIVMFDNKNTGNPPLADGVLATTYNSFSMCSNASYGAQKPGFDMVLRNEGVSTGTIAFTEGPCFPAQRGNNIELDLETIILHELGHALNLAHINDSYEGDSYTTVNPPKLMNYSLLPYVTRRSLDASAYKGALYAVTPQTTLSFGNCGLSSTQMQPIATTPVANDECPTAFPTTPTIIGTAITFDLVHATSNATGDPKFEQVTCNGDGVQVTNNAYYAIMTNSSGGDINIAVSDYTTSPADLASCTGQGIRMAVYKVNACPVGQQFPTPVYCNKNFNGNGNMTLQSLAPNTTYLLYFDGIRNTKAVFKATFTGSAFVTGEPPTGTSSVTVYPNPVTDKLRVNIASTDGGTYAVRVVDMAGRILQSASYTVPVGGQVLEVPFKQFSAGVYIVHVLDNENNILLKQKIVKQNF